MRPRSPATCEVRIADVCRAVGLPEAKGAHPTAPKRCPECHCQVFVTGNYTKEGGLSLQHRRSRFGCPRCPKAYSGKPSIHWDALA